MNGGGVVMNGFPVADRDQGGSFPGTDRREDEGN